MQQEPLNGGAPCPALEERAGCLEYSTRRGQDCGRAFGNILDAFPRWVPCRASAGQGKFQRRGEGAGPGRSAGSEEDELRKCVVARPAAAVPAPALLLPPVGSPAVAAAPGAWTRWFLANSVNGWPRT